MWTLAWRNVWRSRRRSLLTVLSIAFGLAAVMAAQSLMKTVQAQMIEKTTGTSSGHLQVQAIEARDRKLPEATLPRPRSLEGALRGDPRVEAVSARLMYTGLVYSAGGSRGALVAGVEPGNERLVSIMPTYMTRGSYFGCAAAGNGGLRAGDSASGGSPAVGGPCGRDARGLVLGERLAEVLDVRLGEKLVVMAQGKDGAMNSELFRVLGIYRSGSESFDGQIVYIPLEAAQRLRGQEGRISCLVARLRDISKVDEVRSDLQGAARAAGAAVFTWREVGLSVLAILKFEDAVLDIVLGVIFFIVGLGILNTISMSVLERLREFGALRAIGARPGLVARLLLGEAVLLGFMGTAAGLGLGLAVIRYFGAAGLNLPVGKALAYFIPFDSVVYLRLFWAVHAKALAAVAAVTVSAAAAPAARAARIGIAEALRHV